jgi:hypothetical protein
MLRPVVAEPEAGEVDVFPCASFGTGPAVRGEEAEQPGEDYAEGDDRALHELSLEDAFIVLRARNAALAAT